MKTTNKLSITIICSQPDDTSAYDIKINNRHTVLTKQLDVLNKLFNVPEILIVSNGDVNIPKLPNVRVIKNFKHKITNSLYSAGLGLRRSRYVRNMVLMGNMFYSHQCFNLPYDKKSGLVICKNNQDKQIGCTFNEYSKLEYMFYDLDYKWSQILYLCGKELEQIKNISMGADNQRKFLFEGVNEIVGNGGEFEIYQPKKAVAISISAKRDVKLIKRKK